MSFMAELKRRQPTRTAALRRCVVRNDGQFLADS